VAQPANAANQLHAPLWSPDSGGGPLGGRQSLAENHFRANGFQDYTNSSSGFAAQPREATLSDPSCRTLHGSRLRAGTHPAGGAVTPAGPVPA
jgi:hypothetical protein